MVSCEEEEEEYLLHVEFDAMLDSEVFSRPGMFFKVIGIETEKPIMQIEDQVFVGEYRDTAGTSLFFEEDTNPAQQDPVFGKNAEKQLKYMCKTRKALIMHRVFVKKKDPNKTQHQEEEKEKEKDAREEEEEVEDEEEEWESEELTDEDYDSYPDEISESGLKDNRSEESTTVSVGSASKHHTTEKVPRSNKLVKLRKKIRAVKRKLAHNKMKKNSLSKRTLKQTENSEPHTSSTSVCDKTVNVSTVNTCSVNTDIEPVAGPSWAPDISHNECVDLLKETHNEDMNADEMSQLIAEQMSLESDINMQNSLTF